jgi:hypothetical protein
VEGNNEESAYIYSFRALCAGVPLLRLSEEGAQEYRVTIGGV